VFKWVFYHEDYTYTNHQTTEVSI